MQRRSSLSAGASWSLEMQASSKEGFLSRCHLSCDQQMRLGTFQEDETQSGERIPQSVAIWSFLFKYHTHGITIYRMAAEVCVQRTCSMWQRLWSRLTFTTVGCSGSMFRSIPF